MRTPTYLLRTTRTLTLASVALLVSSLSGAVNATDYDAPWETTLNEGKGQTVYFNAWGGGDRINSYQAWAAKEISMNLSQDWTSHFANRSGTSPGRTRHSDQLCR